MPIYMGFGEKRPPKIKKKAKFLHFFMLFLSKIWSDILKYMVKGPRGQRKPIYFCKPYPNCYLKNTIKIFSIVRFPKNT